jgi:hypothetical protein
MNSPFKILFKYPCRGRVNMFFESLDSIHSNVADKNNYHVSCTLDSDDTILNNEEVISRISTRPNTSIEWGLSKSKVDAINRSMPNYDFDIIVCWSNDMVATLLGFDDWIRIYTNNAFADMDGLIHLPEPDSREHLNVLYVATKKYYDRFGYIYHPSYKSLWCDNESLRVAKALNRYFYTGITGFYQHRNPAYHQYGVERDEMFNRQQADWDEDEKNFHEREARNFDL